MKTLLAPLLFTLAGLLRSRGLLHLEILALRQQLAMVTARDHKRLRTRRHERLFWVWLYRFWPGCLAPVAVFQPDTLLRWHQQGFRRYWTWKSRRRRRTGRPATPPEVRSLIRQLSGENPLWGAAHVHGELQMIGIVISQTTVAKYMLRHHKPPSQNWRTFFDNHVRELASIDFFTVPTASFRILYAFLVLRHQRRDVVHFNVTEHPSAQCGRRSKWSRLFSGTRLPSTWCVIAIKYTVRYSAVASRVSVWRRCSSRHVHPGRIPTWSG